MVTNMEPQTVPSYMSVKFTRRTLRMPNFTRAPHAQPSLSNFPKWDSNFSEPTHSRGTTNLDEIFQLPPKIKIPTHTLFDIHVNSNNIFPTDKMNVVLTLDWAPTKEPTVSCWRYTPTPKQDRFQDLLEAICLDFLHTPLTKYNNYHCYSIIPQLLSAEVVLCMHKTTILCQFGLSCHQLTTISPSILNHFWWELYQINKSHRSTPKLTSQIKALFNENF